MNTATIEPPKDSFDKYATKEDLFDLRVSLEKRFFESELRIGERFSKTDLTNEKRFNKIENKIDTLEANLNHLIWLTRAGLMGLGGLIVTIVIDRFFK